MSDSPAPRRSQRIEAALRCELPQAAAADLALGNAPLSPSTLAIPTSPPSSPSPDPTRQDRTSSEQTLPPLLQRLSFIIDWDDPTQEIVDGDPQAVAGVSHLGSISADLSCDTHSAHLSAFVFAPSSPTKAIDTMDHEIIEKDEVVRARLRRALPARWLKWYCVVVPEARRDHLIEVIMASKDVVSVIEEVLEAATRDHIEKALEELVCKLGNTVRSKLLTMRGKHDNGYGKFVSRGTKKVETSGIDDSETYRADIVVQEADPPPAKDGEVKYEWSQLMTFIEVKRRDRQDGNEALAIQGMQYVCKLLVYRSLTSHVYFLSWCGGLARLWYADSASFGHSRAFSLNAAQDRLEIGRFLCLLTSDECSGQVAGKWDPEKDPPVQAVLDSKIKTLDWHLPPRLLYRRSWPFGSRTAVWVGKTLEMVKDVDQSRWMILKCSWVPRHRLGHEPKMQQRLEGIEGTPRPFGSAVIPPDVIEQGFKVETVQQLDPTARDNQTGLHLCAIVYEHRLGEMIDPSIPTSILVHLHAQLVDTLLSYAGRALHYRDLNTGNMLIQKGTKDKLLLVDHGGMREFLRPRGAEWRGDTTVLLKRAEDDARSANLLFLPSANYTALDHLKRWGKNMGFLEANQKKARTTMPENALPAEMERLAIERLPRLRELLLSLVQLSHRYIDDLESAQYLHIWQVASKKENVRSGIQAKVQVFLLDKRDKQAAWSSHTNWSEELRTWFPLMEDWCTMMCSLRDQIFAAQESWRKSVVPIFDKLVSLPILETKVKEACRSGNLVTASEAVIAAFDRTDTLLSQEKLQTVEKDCFVHCKGLMDASSAKAVMDGAAKALSIEGN
ncbi:hypothetical protein BCV69DRAFT_285820 [Microstroma glucosiphilum]|uniref:Fungal-type protein kinase domain-containing protein n=1 Tax=Pseudomicrostroma glucosiphilum TaxID=1684307 RepID=A0A316U451_9BASI|nr:hypothetical protein BCV69DRAFT_285820 [Pseudomicrostroma glucosiphilum]PWN17705.1 hypothetical protein BCV69DRAFT_285820 [Pseudomicrostroma glucosiphilum]